MPDTLIEIGNGFWNVRGSFRVAGLVEAGTQTSLVRLKSGDFVMLDAYTLSRDVAQSVHALTDGGRAVRAVLNLHPYHTLHVRDCLRPFPNAKLYGTRRHKQQAPELAWQELETTDPALHAEFADDLRFSVPRGVDFSPREGLHFASVLAFHAASKTLHVDDTLTWLKLPLLGGLRFHPTLRFVLQRRPGAVAEFRSWADDLVERCRAVEHLCCAHGRALPPQPTPELAQQVRKALAGVEGVLRRHERKFG
ncbi:MAG TPA: hypothetical protein VFX59_28445 [Polyangiales bacterium]|nr:hypothetical protein [Polyangiales bacterium]